MVLDDEILELWKILVPASDYNMEGEYEPFKYYRDEYLYAEIQKVGIQKVLIHWLYGPNDSRTFIFFNFPQLWLSLTKQDFIDLFNNFSKRERFDELFNLMKIVQGYLGLDVYDFIEENEIFRGEKLEKFYKYRNEMEDQFGVGEFVDISDFMINDLKALRAKYIEEEIFKALEIKETSNSSQTDNSLLRSSILKTLYYNFKKMIGF